MAISNIQRSETNNALMPWGFTKQMRESLFLSLNQYLLGSLSAIVYDYFGPEGALHLCIRDLPESRLVPRPNDLDNETLVLKVYALVAKKFLNILPRLGGITGYFALPVLSGGFNDEPRGRLFLDETLFVAVKLPKPPQKPSLFIGYASQVVLITDTSVKIAENQRMITSLESFNMKYKVVNLNEEVQISENEDLFRCMKNVDESSIFALRPLFRLWKALPETNVMAVNFYPENGQITDVKKPLPSTPLN